MWWETNHEHVTMIYFKVNIIWINFPEIARLNPDEECWVTLNFVSKVKP